MIVLELSSLEYCKKERVTERGRGYCGRNKSIHCHDNRLNTMAIWGECGEQRDTLKLKLDLSIYLSIFLTINLSVKKLQLQRVAAMETNPFSFTHTHFCCCLQ